MSGPTRDDPIPKATSGERAPRALADLQLNTLLAADHGTSSEDEAPGIPTEDAQTAIGVSIGEQQTRLTSPKTPAVEKARALDEAGGFFGSGFNGAHESDAEEDAVEGGLGADAELGADGIREERPAVAHPRTPGYARPPREAGRPTASERSPRKTKARLPSPWRVEPKPRKAKGLLPNRKRATSGPEANESTLDSWQRVLMSSLPSMPKHFPFSSNHDSNNGQQPESSSMYKRASDAWSGMYGSGDRLTQQNLARQRSRSLGGATALTRSVSPREQEEAEATLGDLPSRPELRSARSRHSQLRRSASDTSLGPQRTLSRVSSLGDDSRFDHVQDQVNSRLKAIKDSWQDSNIKLPSIPSIGSLTSYRPDFLRERSGSFGRKHSVGDYDKQTDPMTYQPYQSAKAAATDAGSNKVNSHPYLNGALDQLEGDVVVLGGYRGSILRSADPPHRQLWVPIKVGLNLRKADLEVGLKEEDAYERATEKIIPGGMLSHIGPVDISRRLFKRLRACDNVRQGKLKVHDYGYDWRLDPTFLSNQLIKYLERLACNQSGVPKEQRGATVLAHSLGGLITRHAVNQRPELFKGVVYAGVPHTCVNILGPLRNGDEVLLSSRVLTAQVNFTIRTTFALLPLDGRCFLDRNTKEEYVVDFFDPKTWIEYRLSPCIARPLPPLVPQEKPSGISGYVSSVTNALPSIPLPGRRGSVKRSKSPADASKAAQPSEVVTEPESMSSGGSNDAVAEGNIADSRMGRDSSKDLTDSPRTTVTIPRMEAIAYLTRTLAAVKKFKQELEAIPAHAAGNKYPPVAVIYGKSTPTVYGARVNGREGIKHADAYDELAFASGDGVVLARAAMVPEGYVAARGGIVSSERGHVTLLGDLEAVGRCLNAVMAARKRGVGHGT